MADLEIFGPHAVWHPAARQARWADAHGASQEVGVLLGPEGANEDTLERARADAEGILTLRARGVLPLMDVCLVDGRVAWVYQLVRAVGLGHAVGPDAHATMLSTRAAAEVVAEVAEVLLSTGPRGRTHPGPEPTDLLLDRRGRLHVMGFAGPFASSPALRAPNLQEGGDEAAAVYRLGVLLAQLVSGVPPAAPTERGAHPALVRRALIRAMARPGPVLTERYGDWLRGMLAWEPSERPPLAAVPPGLRKVGESTGGPDLVDWADAYVEDLAAAATRPPVRPEPVHQPPPRDPEGDVGESLATEETASTAPTEIVDDDSVPPTVIADQGDEEGAATLPLEDDPTQEAASERGTEESPSRVPVPPVAGMPVSIGPPPQALRPQPRIPHGFLDTQPADSLPSETPGASQERTDWSQPDPYYWLWPALMAMAIAGLALVALVLLGIVVLTHTGPREPEPLPSGPSLEQILPKAPAEEDLTPRPRVETQVELDAAPHPAGQEREEDDAEAAPEQPEAEAAPAEAPVEPFRVVIRAADPSLDLEVRCNDDEGTGIGRVELVGVRRGPCVVTSVRGEERWSAHVSITGPVELTCFSGGASTCR